MSRTLSQEIQQEKPLVIKTVPNTPCNLQITYSQDLLTDASANGVSYGSLFYHPNLLVSQIHHTNGIMETQTNDPNDMRRPSALAASGPYASWSSGTYSYDGAGNIKSIGTSTFAYDKVNRLVTANLFDGPTGGGNLKQQSYTFDAYGNITGITTNGVLRNTPTSANTNRLTGAVTYDAAGNLTSWNGAIYQYDRFNQMTRMASGSEDWIYIYTADDERVWSYSSSLSRWTLKDLDGKVLREYLTDSRGWSVGTDYFYRDGLLLAAETQTGRRHFHLDHLGTPRLITRASGDRAAYHVYYPFGEEATAFNQDTERMKFTGHERDLGSAGGAGDDLDYMHARFCSPLTGRFLSTDPSQKSQDHDEPQSWNRYAYALGNPLKFIDPDGMVAACPKEGCPAPPTTFWGKLAKSFREASMLPGPSAMAVGPRVGGSLVDSLISRIAQLFGRTSGGVAEGVVGAASLNRALTAADLGIKGTVELKGTFSLAEGLATVRVDLIEGSIQNPFRIVDNLVKLATKSGASTLRIEGTLANEKLLGILAKRYGLQTQGGTDVIVIVIKQAAKRPST